jgi:predicted metal-dependent hydrolase
MPEIKLGHRIVPYQIRESKRARYVNFRIDSEKGLEVVIPFGARVLNLEDLLRERQMWILKHLRKFDQIKENTSQRQFVSGEVLPYLDEDRMLDIIQTKTGKRTSVARQANFIRVRLRAGLPERDKPEEIRGALESWYRWQAKEYITKRTAALAAQHGFEYIGVKIRGQRTRWGSCSSKGNLNFNWKLMMVPAAAVDYVIIHELCHLKELNHSAQFWALVQELCPNYKYWVRWLKEHSPQLYL